MASKKPLRTSISRFVLSIPLLLIFVPAWGQDGPPFKWDRPRVVGGAEPPSSSPGTSLTVDLVSVLSEPPYGIALVSIKQTGFTDSGSNLVLWRLWLSPMSGVRFDRSKAILGKDGSVMLNFMPNLPETAGSDPADVVTHMVPGVNASMRRNLKMENVPEGVLLTGFVRGEYYDVMLADEEAGTNAQAFFAPFPIEAKGNGSCRGSARFVFPQNFYLGIFGFEAGEKVTTRYFLNEKAVLIGGNEYKETILSDAEGRDGFGVAMVYNKKQTSLSKGQAQVTVEGSGGCSFSLSHSVGKSALKAE